MICKRCETENPENAVFCIKCGKRLDGNSVCPNCGALCPEEALFCPMCGGKLQGEAGTPENKTGCEPVNKTATEALEKPAAPQNKAARAAKTKKALDLAGGVCLMVGVLFAFVFILCMGLSASMDAETSSVTESSIIWDFFGSGYEDLADLVKIGEFTDFEEYAYKIPLIFSTIVCAGSLLCVLIFTALSAAFYFKSFKNPEIRYTRWAIAAILSFILGAAALLAVNYSVNGVSEITVTYSPATLAGIILCGICLGSYFILRTVSLGKEFLQKQSIADFVCTLCAVLFLILTAAFAVMPALNLSVKGGNYSSSADTNFMGLNLILCMLFDTKRFDKTKMPANFAETYALSIVAQAVGIALIVFAMITLIRKLSAYAEKPNGSLVFSIVFFSLSVLYLLFTCLTLHFGGELLNNTATELSITAAPIVAVVMSAFVLAASITHTVLVKKSAAKPEQIPASEK